MMRWLRSIAQVFLMMASLTGASAAEDAPPAEAAPSAFDREGWYGGLAAVYAMEDFDQPFDDSAGAAIRLGYRAHAHVAAELRYEWLEGFDSSGFIPAFADPALNLPDGDAELDTHQATLAAKLFVLTGRVQPYALVGGGLLVVNTELKADKFKKPFRVQLGFAGRFAAGVDLYLTEHIVLGAEAAYLVPTGPVSGERYGSFELGLQYRF
jgi:opacity protein-like surface antigen